MKSLLRVLFAFAIGPLLGPVVKPAFGQGPLKNPSVVQFTPADYSLIDRFEGGYFQVIVKPDGTCDATTVPIDPVQLENLAKPGLMTDGDVQAPINSRPVLGCFVYAVRAWAGIFSSPWSDPSLPFELTPLRQGRPTIR